MKAQVGIIKHYGEIEKKSLIKLPLTEKNSELISCSINKIDMSFKNSRK
jgi:hypothetical protein